MTKEMAQFLVEVSENAKLRENYSGRGMYGDETYGVVVDSVPQLLEDVLAYIRENLSDNIEGTFYTGNLIPDPSSFRVDNMGMRTILY